MADMTIVLKGFGSLGAGLGPATLVLMGHH
jgi:hypothetical protein